MLQESEAAGHNQRNNLVMNWYLVSVLFFFFGFQVNDEVFFLVLVELASENKVSRLIVLFFLQNLEATGTRRNIALYGLKALSVL